MYYSVFHIFPNEADYALAKRIGKKDTLYPVQNSGWI